MLLQLEIVQYETSQFIDSTFTSMHGWFIYASQFVTLSGDQNDVFKYLVLQSKINLTFTVSLFVYTKAFFFKFGEGRNITIEAFKKYLLYIFTIGNLCVLHFYYVYVSKNIKYLAIL